MNRSDFLKRFIAIAGFGSFAPSLLTQKRKVYLQQFFIAGFRHYRGLELLPHMEENDLLELRREPENEHDDCAIALHWQQEKIGYIPYDQNEMLAKLIDAKALPLLATITHLNNNVKPWENVVAAVYFLQDESIETPAYASYLHQVAQPIYKSKVKKPKQKAAEDIFEHYERIVDVSQIIQPQIKTHFEEWYSKKGKTILYKNIPHILVDTDDIYNYLYQVNALEWVTAEDGKQYILFDFNKT